MEPGGRIVKITGDDVPPAVVTCLAAPRVALLEIAKVAVSCVALATTTLLTVTPPVTLTAVLPETKLAPVKVTPTLVPTTPVTGLTEIRTGVGGRIVKITGDEVPPAVATVTLAAPRVAPLEIVNVAVSCVALTTTTLLTVTPPVTLTVVLPETKLEPIRVTPTLCAGHTLVRATEVSTGVGGRIVKTVGAEVPPDVVTVTLAPPRVALPAMLKVAVICECAGYHNCSPSRRSCSLRRWHRSRSQCP